MRNASLFARYEWHYAIATHLVDGDSNAWFCRIANAADQPLAIVPAYTASIYLESFGQLRCLSLGWDAQLVLFDFPLAPDASASAVGATMMQAFHAHPYPWQAICWGRAMADSNIARIARTLDKRVTSVTVGAPSNTFYTGQADAAKGLEVFRVKSKNLRYRLGLHNRRLQELGHVAVRTARESGDIAGFYAEFLRIEASGWKGEAGTRTALAFLPAQAAFFRSLLDVHTPDFETDIDLLCCGETAIAAQLVIRVAGWEYPYKIGYEESFAKHIPGQILLEKAVERAKSSPHIHRFSLILDLDWHHRWRPTVEPTVEVTIFRSVRRRLLAGLRQRASQQVRKLRARKPPAERTAPALIAPQ